MTISSTTFQSKTSGDGNATEFNVPFPFHDEADVEVYIQDDTTEANTLQVLDTDYTVDISGQKITFTSAPASGKTVIISVGLDLKQEYDLSAVESLAGLNMEEALDRLLLMIQMLQMQINHCVRLSHLSTGTADAITDSASDRADKYLGFDGSGDLSLLT